MKTFLEEYGFVILIAIVVIMLVVIASPIGGDIKASVSGVVDGFGNKTVAKIDKADKEVNLTLNGSILTIESISETDKYIAILRGYQGGKEVSVASVGDKLTCTDSMSNTATFADATGFAETTSGIAKFIIENGTKLDENTKYYIEIMNIGTGEIFKSYIVMMDYQKLEGADGSGGSSTISLTKGQIVTMSDLGLTDIDANNDSVTDTFRVLSIDGANVKLLAMDLYKNSKFKSASNNTYAGSILDTEMTNYYNALPADVQNAIVEQNINQSTYSVSDSTNDSADFSSWYKYSFTESDTSGTNYYLTKTTETNVGNRKVFALDVDDVISYLGSASTPQDIAELFFNYRSSGPYYVWLRSAYAGYSYGASYVDGTFGHVSGYMVHNQCNVRPAFVIDLSLLS